MLHGPKPVQRRAARLRRRLSLPEVLLWQNLRQRPGGLKFRRQHPAGPYIVDFFCARAKLAVEIDGIAHDMGDRAERDELRDDWLRRHGVTVLRFAAREVLADPQEVVQRIVLFALGGYPSTIRCADGPPPLAGEDPEPSVRRSKDATR